jgi:hypothetical protein
MLNDVAVEHTTECDVKVHIVEQDCYCTSIERVPSAVS